MEMKKNSHNANNINYDKLLGQHIDNVEINNIIDFMIGPDYKTIQKFNNVIQQINTIQRIEHVETVHGFNEHNESIFVNDYFPSLIYSMPQDYSTYSLGVNITWKIKDTENNVLYNDLPLHKKYKYFNYHKDDSIRFDTIEEDNRLLYSNHITFEETNINVFDLTYDIDNPSQKIHMIVKNNVDLNNINLKSNIIFRYRGKIIDNYQMILSILSIVGIVESDFILEIFDNIIEKKLNTFEFWNMYNIVADEERDVNFYRINFIDKDGYVINFDNICCIKNLSLYFYNSDLEIKDSESSENEMEEITITIDNELSDDDTEDVLHEE